MKYIFNPVYIKGNELMFYLFLIAMAVIIILTAIFVIKEIKNENK